MTNAEDDTRADEGWRASALLRRPVVHLEHVEQVGEVADVIFDTQSRRVAGLLFGPAGAEGSLMDALRRATGSTLGLTYITAEDIVALDGDVVMIQPRAARRREPGRLPSLRAARGLTVVTMYGRRLGRFADLLLNPDGRAIAGYVLDRSGATPTGTSSSPQDTRKAEPLVIPSGAYLRVGRDLIALSEHGFPTGPSQSSGSRPDAAEWPGEPRAMSFALETPPPPIEHGAYSPDAPTEELRGR